ncbi:MAG TPA: hypothetical protein VNU26_06160 [Mycobacteriales bacterium]|nr:hypothetical protein [Mycobacteriales bacterium]
MERADPVLVQLFERYRTAYALTRGGRSDLAAVDAVLQARVALFEHLVATGWDAPEAVRRQIAVDALLLEQPPSALAG